MCAFVHGVLTSWLYLFRFGVKTEASCEMEAKSVCILFTVAIIFRVVLSPGYAKPFLYWRILLSLIPACRANSETLIHSKKLKNEGMSNRYEIWISSYSGPQNLSSS